MTAYHRSARHPAHRGRGVRHLVTGTLVVLGGIVTAFAVAGLNHLFG